MGETSFNWTDWTQWLPSLNRIVYWLAIIGLGYCVYYISSILAVPPEEEDDLDEEDDPDDEAVDDSEETDEDEEGEEGEDEP